MKRIYLLLFVLLTVSVPSAFSQKGIATVQAGAGIPYGGLGAKVTLTANPTVGFTVGLGMYNGSTLSWGSIDGYGTFNKETLKGLGFSVGLDIWYTCNFYTSFQFVRTGSYHGYYDYNQYEYTPIPLYGVNWTVFGGIVPIGSSGVFFDFGLNLAFLFPSKLEELGGMLGASIGIGYMFGY